HERYDGQGYPEGLQGETIPIASRIVCVVDAYNAMMTKRSYKEAYEEPRARQELIQNAGSQFDPQVIEALLAVLEHDLPLGQSLEPDPWNLLGGLLGPESFQRLVQAHSQKSRQADS
ncbi:MAG: hypothetical protein JO112_11055, partial [Planctomycetes bacterium]|nr:hypothetical protein [Planctomycetota bacterium]